MKLLPHTSSDLPRSFGLWLRDVSELFPGAGAVVAEQLKAAKETFSSESATSEASLQVDAVDGVMPHWRPHSLWLGALAGIVLAAGSSAQSQAAPTLAGVWRMTPDNSEFEERLVGPAPDQAVMVVSRDDADHLSYELVETRRDVEVARRAYDLSFTGGRSMSAAGGRHEAVVAAKSSAGEVSIVAGARGDYHAVVRLRQTGPDSALLEHVLQGPQGEIELERLALVRRDPQGTAVASQGAIHLAGRVAGDGE